MAKPNPAFEKRRRERAKKERREEKARRKAERKAASENEGTPGATGEEGSSEGATPEDDRLTDEESRTPDDTQEVESGATAGREAAEGEDRHPSPPGKKPGGE